MQTVEIHILPNMRRSKSNQTMEFGQLIEYYMKKILLLCIKCGGETIPASFSVKPKLSISMDQQSINFYSLFLLHGKSRAIKLY